MSGTLWLHWRVMWELHLRATFGDYSVLPFSHTRHHRDFTALLFFFGLGICPLFAGLSFFGVAGQSNFIICTRLETSHVDCRIKRAFLGLIPTDQSILPRVIGTELTTNCEDNNCTYAVDLLTNDDVVQLTDLATSDLESVEAEKERIDDFLSNTTAHLLNSAADQPGLGCY